MTPPTHENPSGSLRDRKKERTRRVLQAEALRLFAEKGFDGDHDRGNCRGRRCGPSYVLPLLLHKGRGRFLADARPLLAGLMAARPDESAVQALCHAIVDGLSAFYDQDRERVLDRSKAGIPRPGTPAAPPARAGHLRPGDGSSPGTAAWYEPRPPGGSRDGCGSCCRALGGGASMAGRGGPGGAGPTDRPDAGHCPGR